MPAYAIFIRDSTRDPKELETYSKVAPATLTGHPVTRRVAYGKHEVLEGPEIEGLHDCPVLQLVPPDRLIHQIGELFRRRRPGRVFREAVDFDVEQEMAAVRQGQNLVERGDARAGNRRLFWKATVA